MEVWKYGNESTCRGESVGSGFDWTIPVSPDIVSPTAICSGIQLNAVEIFNDWPTAPHYIHTVEPR